MNYKENEEKFSLVKAAYQTFYLDLLINVINKRIPGFTKEDYFKAKALAEECRKWFEANESTVRYKQLLADFQKRRNQLADIKLGNKVKAD